MPQARNARDVDPVMFNVACPSCGYNLREFLKPEDRGHWFRSWRWENPELVFGVLACGGLFAGVLVGAIIIAKAIQ